MHMQHESGRDYGDALFQLVKLFSGLIERRLIIGCVSGPHGCETCLIQKEKEWREQI